MKKQLIQFTTLLLIALSSPLFAQGTAINSTGTEADASAILDVSSTTQGLLIPRMTSAEKIAISSPATGLFIFQTDGTVGLYFYNGSNWKRLSSESVAAILSTTAASSIASTSATSGGTITDDGGGSSERGICWSTSQNPTTLDDHQSSGSGNGSFSVNITGLTPITQYYVRAYCLNDAGTSYGTQISFTTTGLAVGDSYGGGIVFYLDGAGGALIAAESDQSSSISWDDGTNSNTNVGSTSTAIGTGAANTSTIVSFFASGSYAAQICNDLSLNGYDDWYLPSRDELLELYDQKNVVGNFTWSASGQAYWSSSQLSSTNRAYGVNYLGNDFGGLTTQLIRVRAIRSVSF